MRKLIGTIAVVVGAFVFIVGFILCWRTSIFMARAERANGTIVRLDQEIDGDGGRSYRPIVCYTPAGRTEIEFRSTLVSSPSPFKVGDSVIVLYEPNAPERAEIKAFLPLWFPTLICVSLGIAFLTIGCLVLVGWPARLFQMVPVEP